MMGCHPGMVSSEPTRHGRRDDAVAVGIAPDCEIRIGESRPIEAVDPSVENRSGGESGIRRRIENERVATRTG
jgi:hypothetical protein